MLLSRSILPLLLAALSSAADLRKDQYCFDTCYEASSYVVFAGDDPLSYYQSSCQYPPKVLSIYASATVYCTADEIEAGISVLQEYCKEYGPDLELLPISQFAPNLTKDALNSIPVVSYEEATAASEPYNHSIVLSRSFYESMRKTVDVWEKELWSHTTYGFAMYGFWGGLLLLGMIRNALDVFVSHRFEQYHTDSEALAPPPSAFSTKASGAWNVLNHRLILPFTLGSHHQRKLWGCTIPTRMVSVVVAAYWILNLVLCAVTYEAYLGNMYWPEISKQVLRYIADRTGIVSFANLPLIWMFAGRNNIFLWATGWKYSTFNIFHRNIARIATIEAIVHSAAYTADYLADGKAYYYMEFKEVWFTMGVVYDAYLWAVVAIWGFDRLLRLVRLVYCNLCIQLKGKKIQTTTADATYDDVSGVVTLNVRPASAAVAPHAGQHYYVYMPLAWRGWESHPFTLGTWTLPQTNPKHEQDHNPRVTTAAVDIKADNISSSEIASTTSTSSLAQPSLTFWVRAFGGFTNRLAKACKNSPHGSTSIKVLLEGPYGHREPLHHYESVLLIAGGTGISGVYPYLVEHLARLRDNSPSRTRSLKLVVAARQAAFFHDLAQELLQPSILEESGVTVELFATRDSKRHVVEVLEPASPSSQSSDNATFNKAQDLGDADFRSKVRDAVHDVQIGRPDVELCILDFARKYHAAGAVEKTAVMVCGPGGMADEARSAVLKAGREGLLVDYFEDAFGW